MKKLFTMATVLLIFAACGREVQEIEKMSFDFAKFSTGYDPEWLSTGFDDSAWEELNLRETWDTQGYDKYDGEAVYRIRFDLPALSGSDRGPDLLIYLGKIDDADKVYVNGKYIGGNGGFKGDGGSDISFWDIDRTYAVYGNDPALNWGGSNVLAIRVYDKELEGGMYDGPVTIEACTEKDIASTNGLLGDPAKRHHIACQELPGGKIRCDATVRYYLREPAKGRITLLLKDDETGKTKKLFKSEPLELSCGSEYTTSLTLDEAGRAEIIAMFKGKVLARIVPPYILTPKAPAEPVINGPKVYGVRPGSPVIFKIPASGDKPMAYSVEGLPKGLEVNPDNGVISGSILMEGNYDVTLKASNGKGEGRKAFRFVVGDAIALTPPMGWNSWNCWGLTVTQDKVMASAKAMMDKGLTDYGWSYINIDDAWEADRRDKSGKILTNEKFPDIKGLGDWLHYNGLKMGIYSSPGDETCGHYLGSLGHEREDAETWASWGVDYLKYDWCGYGKVFDALADKGREEYIRPYALMSKILREQKRDIVYSLCQYGMDNVWEWGAEVDAQCWRTTGDITDTWNSLKEIGFSQTVQHEYAAPGRWNDPDMLIVGKVGWGALHDSRLTPDELYTHISLWCLLSSPLLIGCDISQMDRFTFNLLSNPEVLAVNQDVLGKQAAKVWEDGDIQIWMKDVEDGKAIGVFNLGRDSRSVTIPLKELGLDEKSSVRDLWRCRELGRCAKKTFEVPSHGCFLLKLK